MDPANPLFSSKPSSHHTDRPWCAPELPLRERNRTCLHLLRATETSGLDPDLRSLCAAFISPFVVALTVQPSWPVRNDNIREGKRRATPNIRQIPQRRSLTSRIRPYPAAAGLPPLANPRWGSPSYKSSTMVSCSTDRQLHQSRPMLTVLCSYPQGVERHYPRRCTQLMPPKRTSHSLPRLTGGPVFAIQWKCLIVDENSQKVIDNVVSEDDILNNNIASTSLLHPE